MSAESWDLVVVRGVSAGRAAVQDAHGPTIRFGDEVVVLQPAGVGTAPADTAEPLARGVSRSVLHLVVQVGNTFEAEHPDVPVLYRKGRYLLVALDAQRAQDLASPACCTIEPASVPSVMFEVLPRPTAPAARSAGVDAVLAAMSRSRTRERVEALVAFETRRSTDARFREAADWAAAELESAGYDVRLEEIAVGTGKSWNVVAEHPGTAAAPREAVLVTAHLDSVNRDLASGPAPGADDNASGAAALLEMASCLAGFATSRDLRFILFGGEEQGLLGSRAYVRALQKQAQIHAVVNMDMIASRNGTPTPSVLIEGGEVSVRVMDGLTSAAHAYTSLTVQRSLHYYNSDHVPFIDAGIPAVLLIEGNDSTNTRVHTAQDTTAHLDYDLMAEIVRMHLAYACEACGVILPGG